MPESTASRRDAIRHNQNRLLYGGAGFSALGSFGASIVVMVSFAPLNASRAAWAWYAIVTLVYLARLVDYRSFLRSTTPETRPGYWAARFGTGALLAALAWASSLWLILPEGNEPYQVLLILTLGGTSPTSGPPSRPSTGWPTATS